MMLSVGRLRLVENIIGGEVLSETVFNYTISKFDRPIDGRIFFVEDIFF